MGWLNTWGKRRKITISSDYVDSDLTDYPVLIELSSAAGLSSADLTSIFDDLSDNKLRVAFTQSDGTTELYAEVVYWSSSSEAAKIWVKVPSISSSVDTDIYLYWDNAKSDNTSYVGVPGDTASESVWDDYFIAVWHFVDQDPGIVDSTGNGYDGTESGTITYNASGPYADIVSGAYYDVGNITELNGAGAMTLESILSLDNDTDGFWFTRATTFGSATILVWRDASAAGAGTTDTHSFAVNNSTAERFEGTTNAWTVYTPTVVVAGHRYTAGTQEGFINGAKDARTGTASSSVLGTTTDACLIGKWAYGGTAFDGRLYDIRLSSVARSDAWMKCNYYTWNDSLVTYSAVEVLDTYKPAMMMVM